MHRFFEWRCMVLFVEIEDVDDVGAKPAQTGFGCLEGAAARQSTVIRALARRVGPLRRQNPPGPLCCDGASHDFLRTTVIVGVGSINEIDSGFSCACNDPSRSGLIGWTAEHHGP